MNIFTQLFAISVCSEGNKLKKLSRGNYLAVQQLGFHTQTAEVPCSIPGQGTKIQYNNNNKIIHRKSHYSITYNYKMYK